MMGGKRNLALLFTSLVLLTGSSGCVTANFTEPISSFRDSINTASATVGTYYAELNSFERELYLDNALYHPDEEVLATDPSGKPTPLLYKNFPADSVKARTDALILLGVYVDRLGELAGSDAPQKFAEGSKILGENLFSLEKTFRKIGQDSDDKKIIDETAKNYAGPIGTIVGSIGKMYLEQKRDAAVKVAVNDAAPNVRQVLQLLQADLSNVIDPLRRLGLKQEVAERVNYYNIHRKEGLDTQHPQSDPRFLERLRMLNEVGTSITRMETAVIANPASMIQQMSAAHEKLVKYANSKRTPKDLGELVTALETFRNYVKEIATEVEKLRELRKGDK